MIQNRRFIILILFSFLFFPPTINGISREDHTTKINSYEIITKSININNDSQLHQFVTEYDLSGSGTNSSPFIIANLTFQIPYNQPLGFNSTYPPVITIKNTLKNLIIEDLNFDKSGSAIFLVNVSNIKIIDNNFNANGVGIENSSNVTIKDNYFNKSGLSIGNFVGSGKNGTNEHIEISNNYFDSTYGGIILSNLNFILIHDNYFKNCSYSAIEIQSANFMNTKIYHNIFDRNSRGIDFEWYFQGVINISYNHFFDQEYSDFSFMVVWYNNTYGSVNGTINNNNFISKTFVDNEFNGWNYPGLKLDNGTTGNYYSDYTGKDQNHNGIGDIAFYSDNFPLMNPVNFFIIIAQNKYNLPFSNSKSTPFITLPFFLVNFTIIAFCIALIRKKKLHL